MLIVSGDRHRRERKPVSLIPIHLQVSSMAKHIIEFIKHPVNTATIAPDSKELTRIVIEMADLAKAKTVVELGPGSGGFTEQIIKSIPPQTKFFSLEINRKFVKHTKKRCPAATVYHDDALNLKEYMKKHKIQHCDSIVSGLPLTALSEDLQEQILKLVKESLSPGGRFVTYTYVHRKKSKGNARLKRLFHDHFDRLEMSRIVWKNLPPAYVYCAIKE
jgi:phospholipid N-methyltransferase